MADDGKGNVISLAAWRAANEAEEKFLFAVHRVAEYYANAMSLVDNGEVSYGGALAELGGRVRASNKMLDQLITAARATEEGTHSIPPAGDDAG